MGKANVVRYVGAFYCYLHILNNTELPNFSIWLLRSIHSATVKHYQVIKHRRIRSTRIPQCIKDLLFSLSRQP